MAAFTYQALNQAGKECKGVMEGDSPRQIRQKLRDQGMVPLEVETVYKKQHTATIGKFKFQRKQRINVTDLALFTRQMATLLSAGMPLEEVLLGVAEQTDKSKVKSIIIAVRARVLEGYTLAAGLAEFPHAFSPLYRATVAAGEQSGHLDAVLERLADYTERQYHTKQRIQQALVYPIIMSLVSIGIVIFLLIFVVPKMVSVFTTTHQALPTSTTILIAISNGVQAYGIYILLALIVLFIAFKQALKNKGFRKKFHKVLLKTPIIGRAIKIVNTARFARTFGILSSTGVPVLEAMNIASELIINIPMYEAVENATIKVREGANIHRALKQTGFFPPMSIHLIASGEASGQLEKMLERAADNQEREVQGLIDNILTLFEPMLILIMGAIVLFIVLAIMLPIFSLDQYTG